ncbi:hypothetical protein [Aeromicrobium sp. Root495]|uniref:hypothetical protein n=1 Tax=Aeromicrobium sp. Root495 TaxID=1736550 RepID=UPI000AAA818F|nr:hypothetical protein [Aeromicrobium sp. Root495]
MMLLALLTVLLVLTSLLALGALVRCVGRDGYGLRPPPRSHTHGGFGPVRLQP